MLPAQILIPDHPQLRKAFASALAGTMHLVEVADDQDTDIRGDGGGLDRLPRYELQDLSDPRLRSATVLTQDDGIVLADELARYVEECKSVNIPEVYAPRVAVVSRRGRPPLRIYSKDTEHNQTSTDPSPAIPDPPAAETVPADPRSLNQAHRARMTKAAGWMAEHVDHDRRYSHVGVFQANANQAAGIPTGGRDHATVEQLTAATQWMMTRIIEHCEANHEEIPSWVDGEE